MSMDWVYAKDILSSNRLDVVIKYKYIEAKDRGENIEFAKKLYASHIDAFSDGTFTEPMNIEKNTIEKYLESFDVLIEEIKRNGFREEVSIIPVGRNNTLCNGSHRMAICLYFGIKMKIERKDKDGIPFNVAFMEKQRMPEKFINYTIGEYVRLNKNSTIFWYNAGGVDWINKIDNSKLLLKKRLSNYRVPEHLKKYVACKSYICVVDTILFEESNKNIIIGNWGTSQHQELIELLEEYRESKSSEYIREVKRKIDRKLHYVKKYIRERFPALYWLLKGK